MSAVLLQSAPTVASSARTAPASRAQLAGRILTGIAAAFLTFDVVIKLVSAKAAVDGTVQLGYQPHHLPIIGVLGAICLVLYLVPRTAPLGAILWTGYFGGAVASNLRLDLPLASHTLFPIYFAALVWGALYLRDPRVRALLRAAR